MKIYFNRRPVQGPWGGGSKILSSIITECLNRQYQLFFEDEINTNINFDIMFCIDPRPSPLVDFGMLLRKKFMQPNVKLIQRVGDLGTHGKPEFFELIKASTQRSDILIFPSNWAKDYLNSQKKYYIIQNAPLKEFIIDKKNNFNEDSLNIVSHHWSDNKFKGFDIYKQLNEYCKDELKFTFIGRKPVDLEIKNYIPPQDVKGLISELPKHDVYITASKYEAGANHVLEAMALGLPVLYHKDGGSINEYCKDFGIQYENFEELIYILENKKELLQNIANNMSYTRSSIDMAKEYVDLFETL